jgi:4-hydroxy-tetrahydrodipicolinate synthase
MSGRLTERAEGVFIISATPFNDDGSLDYTSADRLVNYYIERGVSGMTILGMMGEAPKLTAEEANGFMAHMLKRVAGRVPVIVGVSGAGLGNLAHLSRASMDAGAAGVMIAPIPGLNTETKIFSYFEQVFAALGPDIPVCFQDYPQSTGVHISVECFNRLVDEFAQLVMFKHEDCPGLSKLSALRDTASGTASGTGRRRVSILVGNGGLYLPQELARGADGAMTGFAYPEMLVKVVSLYKAGNTDRAQDIFDAYLPLVRHEQQPGYGLAVRKEVLRRRGAIACAATRPPGPRLTAIDMKELDRLIARMEAREVELG